MLSRARNSAPCVIFFDEFDALCPKRSDSHGDRSMGPRGVNQLRFNTILHVGLPEAADRIDILKAATKVILSIYIMGNSNSFLRIFFRIGQDQFYHMMCASISWLNKLIATQV